MKLTPFALGCVTFAFLAGCHHSSTSPTSKTVSGIASVGSPLVGVVVFATDVNGHAVQSTVTDPNGKFTLSLQGDGPFILTTPVNDADGSPAYLSSVYLPTGQFAGSLQANINPLTSLITSRVLHAIPKAMPTGIQIIAANITSNTVANAEQEIATLFQPVYTALAVPAAESADPIGTTLYQANNTDPLDNFFTSAHFILNAGEVVIGTDANRSVVNVPATGALASIPTASITSFAALVNGPTTTPITNVIVVIGENQTFDAVFGTYQAPQGQTVSNLLSKGIVNADGSAGPNFSLAAQNQAATQTTYSINPTRTTAYTFLPQPLQIGELTTSLSTLGGTPDPNFPANLANGPFQLTKYVPYTLPANNFVGVTTGDPVHRFFQMWQQTGGNNAKLDMFTWVATTVGQGGDTTGITPANPAQGGELMGFVNMSAGDAPYWKSLAQSYAISDNYHQSILGGTGANFYTFSTADLPFFNTAGVAGAPPANQIENPNPMAGTPNFYTQDGYSGGSYVNCADATQAGVAPILAALAVNNVASNCAAGNYYLVNNYAPGYDMNGVVQPIGPNNYNYPPQTVPTIAESLANKGVSWKWYTGAREVADVVADAATLGVTNPSAGLLAFLQTSQYNAIGDPLVASQKVMTTPSLKAGLAGLTTFYNDVQNNTLPSVSFVVPKNLESGHPGYSVEVKYETFLQDLIAKVQANPTLWAHTAIIVTTDEGGGHFDTGYIQNQDFFGDGPRIPMVVISPYARTNFIDHTYHDHASVLKFIERNWKLAPISARSRDNHPLPVTTVANPYKPINSTPALGDLMTMFNF